MSYLERDFNKCLFNPFVVDLFEEYSQLKEIKDISPYISNKLMKYIIAVYDYKSPIVINNRELKIRKQLAAEFAGYDLMKDDLKPIFELSADHVIKAVDLFLKKFIHSRIWYMICCNENIFFEYGQRMLTPVAGKSEDGKPMTEKAITEAMVLKTKLSDDMATIDERLDAAYKRLYGGEQVDKFLSGSTTPERMALERSKQN